MSDLVERLRQKPMTCVIGGETVDDTLGDEAADRIEELDDLLERADYVRHQQIQFINLLQKEIKALKEGVAFSPVCPPLSNEKSS